MKALRKPNIHSSLPAKPSRPAPGRAAIEAAYAQIDQADVERSRIKQFPPQYRAKLATEKQE